MKFEELSEQARTGAEDLKGVEESESLNRWGTTLEELADKLEQTKARLMEGASQELILKEQFDYEKN